MKSIITIWFVLLANCGFSQISTFSKFYVQDSFYAGNYTVIAAEDSLVLMPNYFDGRTFQGFFFIKTDINGNKAYRFLISKPDTFYGFHYGLEAHRTHTGHYIFGGQIFKSGGTIANTYLYKLNSVLDTVYLKEIAHQDCSYLNAATELSDNNYLISGYKKSCLPGQVRRPDAMMIKTDTNGNVIWQYQETHQNYSAFSYAAVYPGGFYISTELLNADPQSDSLIEVRKYDNAGHLRWSLPLGISGHLNRSGQLISMRDGGGIQLLSVLDTGSSTTNIYDPSVIYRFDSNGNIIWQKWLISTNTSSICELRNGSIVFSQSSNGLFSDTTFYDNYRGELFCLDGQSGNMLWDKLYTQGVDTNLDAYFLT